MQSIQVALNPSVYTLTLHKARIRPFLKSSPILALVKAGVKFPNGQAKMFQSEKPDADLLFASTPSILVAEEALIHNI